MLHKTENPRCWKHRGPQNLVITVLETPTSLVLVNSPASITKQMNNTTNDNPEGSKGRLYVLPV